MGDLSLGRWRLPVPGAPLLSGTKDPGSSLFLWRNALGGTRLCSVVLGFLKLFPKVSVPSLCDQCFR